MVAIVEVERLWLRFQQLGVNKDGFIKLETHKKYANHKFIKNILTALKSPDGNVYFSTFCNFFYWLENSNSDQIMEGLFHFWNNAKVIDEKSIGVMVNVLYPKKTESEKKLFTNQAAHECDDILNKNEYLEVCKSIDQTIIKKYTKFEVIPPGIALEANKLFKKLQIEVDKQVEQKSITGRDVKNLIPIMRSYDWKKMARFMEISSKEMKNISNAGQNNDDRFVNSINYWRNKVDKEKQRDALKIISEKCKMVNDSQFLTNAQKNVCVDLANVKHENIRLSKDAKKMEKRLKLFKLQNIDKIKKTKMKKKSSTCLSNKNAEILDTQKLFKMFKTPKKFKLLALKGGTSIMTPNVKNFLNVQKKVKFDMNHSKINEKIDNKNSSPDNKSDSCINTDSCTKIGFNVMYQNDLNKSVNLNKKKNVSCNEKPIQRSVCTSPKQIEINFTKPFLSYAERLMLQQYRKGDLFQNGIRNKNNEKNDTIDEIKLKLKIDDEHYKPVKNDSIYLKECQKNDNDVNIKENQPNKQNKKINYNLQSVSNREIDAPVHDIDSLASFFVNGGNKYKNEINRNNENLKKNDKFGQIDETEEKKLQKVISKLSEGPEGSRRLKSLKTYEEMIENIKNWQIINHLIKRQELLKAEKRNDENFDIYFEQIPCMLDDILIFANTKNRHDKILKIVLERLKYYNIVLNVDKCDLAKDSIKILGRVLDKNRVKIDTDKISPLLSLPTPKNKWEIKSLLGMA
ncbi:hypothetical protein A3Q56_04489, partial [Intoshia linei]